jgi:diguanylate cyclase
MTMVFSWPIFLIGLLLGILQIAVGVIIGRALPLSQRQAHRAVQRRGGQLVHLAGGLTRLAQSVAQDVGQHRAQIKQVSDDLAAQPSEGAPLTDFVLKTVAEIVQINERLQNRLSAAEDKLQQQAEEIRNHIAEARTDALTGLPNRRAFDDELVRRIAEWQRKKSVFCLLLVDIDRFKDLNDRHGHPAADEVLRGLAETFRGVLRQMDLVARIGGEEFGVVLPSTNPRDAMYAAERLRSAVASAQFATTQGGKRALAVTISLGLATVGTGDDSISLLRRADEALYAAKRSGRNCGYFHDGAACQRIARGDEVARDGDSDMISDSAAMSPTEIRTACEELRAKLVALGEEK